MFSRLRKPVVHVKSANRAARNLLVVGSALLLVVCFLAVAPGYARAANVQPATANFAQPCGNPGTPPQVQHVVWIWMENESYSGVIGNANAPYQTALAHKCGTPTNFHNESHPSLDNYIAATDGQSILNTSFLNDCSPNPATKYCVSSYPSIFSQVQASGETWAGYDEDMPSNCDQTNSGNYAVRHNPAAYYPALSTCGQYDVPMGTLSTQTGAFYSAVQGGTLPNFSFITPNLIDDAHNSSTATGDAWLSQVVPLIISGPNYQSGNTVIFITNDEGAGPDLVNGEDCANPVLDVNQPSCHIPTIVVAPYVPAGTLDGAFYTHYSLLRTTEELLGLPLLGLATSANSMTANFNLGTVTNTTVLPAPPTDLAAAPTSPTQVNLSWQPSTPGNVPVSDYQVMRNGTAIGTTTGTTYTDTTASAGASYSYTVSAIDSNGLVSLPSVPVAFTMPVLNNLLVNPGFESWSGGAPVGWTTYGPATTLTQSTDAHSGSYSVKVATTSTSYAAAGVNDGAPPTISSTTGGTTYNASCWVKASAFITINVQLHEDKQNGASANTAAVSSLMVPNTISWNQVQVSYTAIGTGNKLPLSVYSTNTVSGGATFEVDDCSLYTGTASGTTPPAAPANLTATAVSPTQVSLAWTAAVPGSAPISSYQVYRNGTLLATVPGTTDTDSSVSPSTSYSYYVIAVDANSADSPASNTAAVTTPALIPPSAPGNLTATAVSPAQVNLSWTAATPGNEPIAGYQIVRNGSVIGTAAATAASYSDTTASAGMTYNYTVAAVDSLNDIGAASNTATVTTPTVLNLLANPGFEQWSGGLPVGWTTYGPATTLTQSTDAHSGSYSVKIATTSSTYAASGINDGAKPTISSTVAGTTYTASCWVKASASITVTVQLHEVTQNWASVNTAAVSSLHLPTTTSWYQIQVTYTTIGTGNKMPLSVYSTNTVSGGATFQVDDCSLSGGT